MKNILRSRSVAVTAGAVVLVGIGGVGAANAAGAHLPWNSVGTNQIRNNSIRSHDIRNGNVRLRDLSPWVGRQVIKANRMGPQGTKGDIGPAGPQGEPGLSNVNAGAVYTNSWKGDGGKALNTIVETCPDGQAALGGGYSTFGGDKDLGGTNKDIQVTVSAPYFSGDYKPVNKAGNFLPNEWVIKGYNNGSTDQVVRAWVVCANVAQQ